MTQIRQATKSAKIFHERQHSQTVPPARSQPQRRRRGPANASRKRSEPRHRPIQCWPSSRLHAPPCLARPRARSGAASTPTCWRHRGEALDAEGLKAALALHTRSTRYLSSVAAGMARHDLQGRAVEAMAPSMLHALLEVHKRRQGRSQEDLKPKLRQRIVQAFEASGLSREDYAALLPSRDPAIRDLFDQALDEAAARAAGRSAAPRLQRQRHGAGRICRQLRLAGCRCQAHARARQAARESLSRSALGRKRKARIAGFLPEDQPR